MQLVLAQSTLQEDNERVRVTRWTLPPNSETGHHVHEHDYVVVPVEPGTLSIVEDDGTLAESVLTLGGSYFRKSGVSHNVTNRGPTRIVFVEIEIK